MTPTQKEFMDKQILMIAKKEFSLALSTVAPERYEAGLETLHSDRLDFVNCAIWEIRKALEQAYRAGHAAANLVD